MKILISIIMIYFLVLLQSSFMVFFDIQGYVLNLVLILVLLFNLFESSKSVKGLILAFFGGFFLDIFSSELFGIDLIGLWIFILIALSVFIKYIFKKHFSFVMFGHG